MFIHFLCLCPLRLAMMLNFNISKVAYYTELGTLSNDDGSENVAKKMNLRSFKVNRVYLDRLNMTNAGDFSCS